MSWLDLRHSDYDMLRGRSEFARLYRSGEVSTRAENQARTLSRRGQRTGLRGYADRTADMHLMQRSQGETVDAYIDRVMVSRYPRHFGRIVASFIGSLLQVEDEKQTQWGPDDGEGLGDPMEAGTVLHGYWQDIDGAGTDWPMMIVEALDALITKHGQWYFMDPPADGRGKARLHLLQQENVLNWRRENGRLVEVLLRETIDRRTSIRDETPLGERYLYVTLDGWERYQRDEDGDAVFIEGQEWAVPFYRTPERQERRLPIGWERINLAEPVGYNTALDARYLYNLLSDVRWAIRRTSFSKLAPTDFLTEEQAELAKETLAQGHNFLTFPGNFIAPDASVYEVGYDIYKEEVRDFYVTALQSYEDAARERTATELRQEKSAGPHSFLSVLAAAIDEYANDLLFLIEQIERPDDPALWRTHTVQRTRNFEPVDATERGRELANRYFGKDQPVPIGETGKQNAAKEIAGLDGIQVDEDEITGELEGEAEARARRERRQELAAQADERAIAAEQQINGEAG